MKLKKIVDKPHYGYQLLEFCELTYTPKELKDIWGNKKLESIPHKISAFIERNTIKEAFKISDYKYLIIDTDNKTHELIY